MVGTVGEVEGNGEVAAEGGGEGVEGAEVEVAARFEFGNGGLLYGHTLGQFGLGKAEGFAQFTNFDGRGGGSAGEKERNDALQGVGFLRVGFVHAFAVA